MRNCFSRFISSGITLLSIVSMASCTPADNNLGSHLIPGNQRMKLKIDTIGLAPSQSIGAFNTFTDTIKSHNQAVAIMGRAASGIFGKTSAATLLQYLPSSVRTDTFKMSSAGSNAVIRGFGYGAKVDSMKLLIAMNHMVGDKNVEQTFNIYMLQDSLRTDTTYYVNFPYEKYIAKDPAFTFKYKGESANADVEHIKTEITPVGEKFLAELISNPDLYNFTKKHTPLFKKKFTGFVVAPAESSPTNGALYYTTLPYSFFEIYLHNYTDATLTKINAKSVRQSFYFDDKVLYDTIPRNHSVISVNHDYSGTVLDGVKEKPIKAARTGYVQGVAGVTCMLEFPDAFFQAIDDLKENPDDDIMINQAMMYVYLENDDNEHLDASHHRLGSYMRYSTLTPIPDYLYTIEESSKGKTVPAYGGMLNRTYGYYAMDITQYVHLTMKNLATKNNSDNKSKPYRFTLAPIAYPRIPNEAFIWKETALSISDDSNSGQNLSGQKKIRVRLTYTLIKR